MKIVYYTPRSLMETEISKLRDKIIVDLRLQKDDGLLIVSDPNLPCTRVEVLPEAYEIGLFEGEEA